MPKALDLSPSLNTPPFKRVYTMGTKGYNDFVEEFVATFMVDVEV